MACKIETMLMEKSRITVVTNEPILVLTQNYDTGNTDTDVVDYNNKTGWLNVKSIDESYDLIVTIDPDNNYEVYIPKGRKCNINVVSTGLYSIAYKNIEFDAIIDNNEDWWDSAFTILEE